MAEHTSDSSYSGEDWPEEEIKVPGFILGRYIYYALGKPLWTREQLQDLQAQLNANPERFTIRLLNNTTVEVKNAAYGEDASHWRTEVEFLGWRHLVYPSCQLTHALAPGDLDFQFFPYIIHQKDTRLEEYLHILPSHDEHELHQRFNAEKALWAQCDSRYLIEELLSEYELPPTMDKIVCLGLGNDLTSTFEFSSQYSAALTLREFLEKKLGHPVRLLAQNPDYTSDTEHVLEKEGFEVVGMNGIDGFLEIDENSLVLAIYAGSHVVVRVREILAELARPAVIIDHYSFPKDPSWNYKEPVTLGAVVGSIIRGTRDSDPTTPRTEAVLGEYYDAGFWVNDVPSAFLKEAPWWAAGAKVLVRKRGSKFLKTEGRDERLHESPAKNVGEMGEIARRILEAFSID